MDSKIPEMGRPPKKGRAAWGPPVWTTLHMFAASYKPESCSSFKNFIYSLPDILPCQTCGDHLRKNLQRYPPENYMRNNHELFFWTYFIHDLVNQQCNKRLEDGEVPKQSPSFDDAKRYYFSSLGEECNVCQL